MKNIPYFPSVKFGSEDWTLRVQERLTEDGVDVAVISDFYTPEECTRYMNGLVDHLSAIAGRAMNAGNWEDQYLPPQTRPGLFQSLACNGPTPWALRTDVRLEQLWRDLYSHYRNSPVRDLIVSNDGINIRPPIGPWYTGPKSDWAHFDQTDLSDLYKCIQGQVVLSDTTAGFVASPKSHKVYGEILEVEGVNNWASNWVKLSGSSIKAATALVQRAGGAYQIPIYAPRGSVILWLSTTLHAAKLQDGPLKPPKDCTDPYYGWRGVVYVCFRPRDEFGAVCLANNRATNHWGTKVFAVAGAGARRKPTDAFSPRQLIDSFTQRIKQLLVDPSRVWAYAERPQLDEHGQRLAGLLEPEEP